MRTSTMTAGRTPWPAAGAAARAAAIASAAAAARPTLRFDEDARDRTRHPRGVGPDERAAAVELPPQQVADDDGPPARPAGGPHPPAQRAGDVLLHVGPPLRRLGAVGRRRGVG